jgi:hypothetical protein
VDQTVVGHVEALPRPIRPPRSCPGASENIMTTTLSLNSS